MNLIDKKDAPELRIDWGEAFKKSLHPDIDHNFADFGLYTKRGWSKAKPLYFCVMCGYMRPTSS